MKEAGELPVGTLCTINIIGERRGTGSPLQEGATETDIGQETGWGVKEEKGRHASTPTRFGGLTLN